MITALLATLLLLPPTPVEVTVVQFAAKGKASLTLGPKGKAEVERTGTVTRIAVQMEGLQFPQAAKGGMNSYVVWAVSPEGIFENLGELEQSGAKGTLEATTRFDRFAILVTFEPHYMVDKPSSAVVYRGQNPETELRRKVVPVEVGAYDYSQLKAPAAAPYNIVVQARTSFQIAQAAGAATLAPADFRNAQVALGAMEELVSRASPLDIVWPTTNEAIRWSQRSATVARAKR